VGEILKDKLDRIESSLSQNSWNMGYGLSEEQIEWMIQKIKDQNRDIMRIKEAFSEKDKEIERLRIVEQAYAAYKSAK
jgi:hypothetical protein